MKMMKMMIVFMLLLLTTTTMMILIFFLIRDSNFKTIMLGKCCSVLMLLLMMKMMLLLMLIMMMANGDKDALPVCSSNNTYFVSAQTTSWFAGERENSLHLVLCVYCQLHTCNTFSAWFQWFRKINIKLQNH